MAVSNQPVGEALAPAVTRLVNTLVTKIANQDAGLIDKYLEALTTHPVAGLGFEIKVLWGLTKLGEFDHADEQIRDFIRANFEQMDGSLSWSVAEMFLAIAIGYSFSEFSTRQEGIEWRLDTLLAIDPRNYTFKGAVGSISHLEYRSSGNTIDIPYKKGVHIVNQAYLALGRDPYGIAQCKRIVAAVEAWKILIAEMVIYGQRQATPIVVAKVPSDQYIVLTDEFGNPKLDANGQELRLSVSDQMTEQLEQLDNRSILVTDIQNQVEALLQGGDAGVFFFEALRYLERVMLMGEVVPETVVSTGISGTGDSELNTGHMALMDMSIGATVSQIKEGILERVTRPLIEWRYGPQDSYGEFKVPKEKQEDEVALLNAIRGVCDGPLLTNQDLQTVNRARELAGIPKTTEIIERITTDGALNGSTVPAAA